jgi:ferredoxin/flavodoxin---NADP+ reductase
MAAELLPARVTDRQDWSRGLFSLTFDLAVPIRAGQFVTVGTVPDGDRHTRRAYSVASAPGEPTELLVVEVDDGRVSPLLSAARPGDTLYVSERGKGLFTLDAVPPGRELWLIATGTGLAPFRSMLRDGAALGAHPTIVLAYGVRHPEQLAYLGELRALAAALPPGKLRIVPLCTRAEPPPGGLPGRVTERLDDGTLEAEAGLTLDPARSHALLCGNPEMIDAMLERLAARGMARHTPRAPGHVTTERYW